MCIVHKLSYFFYETFTDNYTTKIKNYSMEINSIKPNEFFISEKEGEHGLVNVQLRIDKNEDRDKIIGELMKSLNKGSDIMDGVSVEQIYFKGADIGKSFEELKDKLRAELNEVINKYKY